MSADIRQILADWRYDANDVTVRTIQGDDGRERIQLRLDLGLMQMEVDGRPDGQQFDGHESLLAAHQDRRRRHEAANPEGAPYQLASEECAELMREGVQYYHRYVSLWRLKRYELCARDTDRHLQMMRFVRSHARHDSDRLRADQWRPYATMMHARAVATPLVGLRQWEAAMGAIDAGIRGFELFLDDYGKRDNADKVSELAFLRRWRDQIAAKAGRGTPLDGGSEDGESTDATADNEPVDEDPIARTERLLSEAVEHERYEDAARLRDELRRLEAPPTDHLGGEPPEV